MELTDSFLTLLQSFDPVFTAPTYQTFVAIVTGWILSQRHRFYRALTPFSRLRPIRPSWLSSRAGFSPSGTAT